MKCRKLLLILFNLAHLMSLKVLSNYVVGDCFHGFNELILSSTKVSGWNVHCALSITEGLRKHWLINICQQSFQGYKLGRSTSLNLWSKAHVIQPYKGFLVHLPIKTCNVN